jgi:UDP-glucuronate 4-epimerase
MRVLVTGGAGFIGSHLVDRLLANGHVVTVLDSFDEFYSPATKRRNISGALSSERFRLLEGDIRDQSLLDAAVPDHVDVIVHLAARAGVRPSLEQPVVYGDVNVNGTVTLLEFARRRGISRFIFASSSSVYGNDALAPFREAETADRPISPYAATKRAGELLAYTYHDLFGLSVACLRFFTVYGPRQRPDLAIHKFARRMLRGDPITVYGDGSMRRDFTYIDDIIQGVQGALAWTAQAPRYDIFNLGESQTTSVAELIGLLEETLAVKARVEFGPEQPGDVRQTCADITKARTVLGYSPVTSMREGLARFSGWLSTQR